ncbi:CPBP family intramembrane glutamic endopeptidase [Fructilactobacillus carniphilus]|uniref:CPBP family intramembrane metalloprotease n=1 Tax=Fructilactobacillus carniphilus TaxID=2940297 RepID=A0ABY5BXX6_9LACO|nr:CPBP family intramembrane glutamic endopeptidase [Fructilactobacillus carniphilus]USS90690.1 CPBP family intramembrane metalloprotease [Fructilactobacillus carniphilus]
MTNHFHLKIGLTLIIYIGLILGLNFFHRLVVPQLSRTVILSIALPIMWLALTLLNHFYLHQPLFYYHRLTQSEWKNSWPSLGVTGMLIILMTLPVSFHLNLQTFLMALNAGILEELCFRGLIFPLTLQLFGAQYSPIATTRLAILTSSALFSFLHILNLMTLGQALLPTILQISFTFCLGTITAILYFQTRNLWLAMGLHFWVDVTNNALQINSIWGFISIIIVCLGLVSCLLLGLVRSTKCEHNLQAFQLKKIAK